MKGPLHELQLFLVALLEEPFFPPKAQNLHHMVASAIIDVTETHDTP
jgi:hypothetical protein